MATRSFATLVGATMLLVIASCSGSERDSSASLRGSSTSSSAPTTPQPEPAGGHGSTSVLAAPNTVAATTSVPPQFHGAVTEVPAEVRARMDGVSMRPGCPVGYDQLRYLRLAHWDFSGRAVTGELVVNAEAADGVLQVFRTLFDARFPIRRMTLVDDFGRGPRPEAGADDMASVAADNTSAFNCRVAFGGSSWSEHAYGRAIDLNPIENPYVFSDGTTTHEASIPYLDRSLDPPGMVRSDDVVVRAFRVIGWTWGGTWSGVKDYQHFSASGR